MNDRRSLIKLLGLSPWHDRTATRTGIAGQNAFSSYAADLPVPQPVPDDAVTDPITDYFLHWFDRAEEAQATQPHWMTPITTVTPRLEQEYR